MFTFIIAIDDKTLFQPTENYNVEEKSSRATLLLLVWQKTRFPVYYHKLVTELRRVRRASKAPWVRKIGKP